MADDTIPKDLPVDTFLERVIPEWKDDNRMNFYMQSFKSNRDVNPQEWDAKLTMWSNVIHLACQYRQAVVAKTSTLKQFMTRERREAYSSQTNTPLGWYVVISELEKRSELIDVNEFKNLFNVSGGQSIGKWLLHNVIFKPASLVFWSRSKEPDQIVQEKTYVVMRNVKILMDQLVNHVYTNKVSHLDLFVAPFEVEEHFNGIRTKTVSMSKEEINLLLDYLHCEGPAKLVLLQHGRRGLRFFEDQTLKMQLTDPQVDHGTIQLKETLYTLDMQRKELESRIQETEAEIVQYLQKKQRQVAKQQLVKKKMFESILEKRIQSYNNIDQMLTSIESAHSDAEVIQSLKTGTQAIKNVTGVLEDMNPEEVLDQAAEAMTDYAEIQRAIDVGMDQVHGEDSLDEEDILKELEQLSLDEEAKKQPVPVVAKEPVADAIIEKPATRSEPVEERAITPPPERIAVLEEPIREPIAVAERVPVMISSPPKVVTRKEVEQAPSRQEEPVVVVPISIQPELVPVEVPATAVEPKVEEPAVTESVVEHVMTEPLVEEQEPVVDEDVTVTEAVAPVVELIEPVVEPTEDSVMDLTDDIEIFTDLPMQETIVEPVTIEPLPLAEVSVDLDVDEVAQLLDELDVHDSQEVEQPFVSQEVVQEVANVEPAPVPVIVPTITPIQEVVAPPNDSVKCLEFEISQLDVSESKKKENLNLTLKLLRLKMKKIQRDNKLGDHVAHLKQVVENLETKALDLQTENKTEDAVKVMKYIELLEEEIADFEKTLAPKEELLA